MKTTAPSARIAALTLLESVIRHKRTLDEALAANPLRGAEADTRFTMLLVLTVLRHLGQIDAILAAHLSKPLPAKRMMVSNTLRIGVAQLLWLTTPAHAAVNETVALIKKGPNAGLSGLVNAVLQKIARERPAIPAPSHNLPPHVMQRWIDTYGSATVNAMAEVAAERPPLDLHTRVEMPDTTRLDSHMVRLPYDHPSVESLTGYSEGTFFVQDLAASYPARLLGNVSEHQVLDLCAAPGGKTMQLIEAGGFVTAVDSAATRMSRLKENLGRTRMQANCVTADIMQWQPTRAYDAILLDAPCSATGTWRRHPEVVHNVTAADIAELVRLQRAMFTRAWQWLKPGGKFVYCVCSLEQDEGEAQARWFLKEQADAVISPIDAAYEIPSICITTEGYLRTRPDMLKEQGGMDGFFAACFTKKTA
jgi:16S rRNA (cytosine967-C5)-methyltransferase